MQRPQRHRLLQGYPALPLMGPAVGPTEAPDPDPHNLYAHAALRRISGELVDERASRAAIALKEWDFKPKDPNPDALDVQFQTLGQHQRKQLEAQAALPCLAEPPLLNVDRGRALIVGVLPHTQCIPRVEGCGFCTFPHDAPGAYDKRKLTTNVVDDIRTVLSAEPEALQGRAVDAVYFGGGTANLTPIDDLRSLFDALARGFDLRNAEVSLEGIPKLFTSWFYEQLKMMVAWPVRRRRISMGIQTFDSRFIEMMGRQSFGDQSLIRKLVKKCRSMDIGTSGDLLFNLPGQTATAMADDVDRALDCGLDQICLYNLVLYKGLGTLWSEIPKLVDAMPGNDEACAHWLHLRARLIAAGYVQTTLTNFERSDVAGDRAFVYERASFSPDRTDGVGFGPLSISSFVDPAAQKGVKLVRRKDMQASPWSGGDLYYAYGPAELRVLFVTRSLAKTSFSRAAYQAMFHADVADDFPASFSVLENGDLLAHDRSDDVVSLTPRGMFYSDSVVATFAAEQNIESARALGLHTTKLLAERLQTADYFGMG